MPFHHMKVRLTITHDLMITAAEAVTIAGPYAVCPIANDVFANLVGIQIGPGWRRKVSAAIGGNHGCTHITELMGPVATIAYQTLYGEDSRQARQSENDNTKHRTTSGPVQPTAVLRMPSMQLKRQTACKQTKVRVRDAAQVRECYWLILLRASRSPFGVAASVTYP